MLNITLINVFLVLQLSQKYLKITQNLFPIDLQSLYSLLGLTSYLVLCPEFLLSDSHSQHMCTVPWELHCNYVL